MTLLNIALLDDVATVAADELVYDHDGAVRYGPDGQAVTTSKILALPHAGCVLAVAGSSALLHYVHARSCWMPSFDVAVERLPEMLNGVGHVLKLAQGRFPQDAVFVVGWSEKHKRMAQLVCESKTGFMTDFQAVVTLGGQPRCSLLPPMPAELAMQMPFPGDPGAMLALARAQVKHRAEDPTSVVPYGGRLLVATVRRDGIELAAAGSLGEPRRDGLKKQPVQSDLRSHSSGHHIIEGGHIEILWRHGAEPWRQVNVPGDATGVYLDGMKHSDRVVIEARAVNGLGKRGPSSFIGAAVVGATSIDTGQIATQAATIPLGNIGSDGTITSFLGSILASTSTWINNLGYTVDIQIEWAAFVKRTAGANPCYVSFVYETFSPSVITGVDSPEAGATEGTASFVRQVSLANGQQITAVLYGSAGSTSTLAFRSPSVRMTILKR